MPFNAGGIKVIAPQRSSVVVTITNTTTGATPVVYSDAALLVPLTLPVTVVPLGVQNVFFTSPGGYTLSVKYNNATGTEIASPTSNTVLPFEVGPGEIGVHDYTTALIPATAAGKLNGLSIGRTNVNIPVGLHTHMAADTASNGTDYSVTHRTFHPLTDPTVDAILPVFSNQGVSTAGGAVDFDAPNPITISAAVETSDGAIVPLYFNGSTSITLPAVGGYIATPDYPVSFGSQVTTTDKFSVTTSPGVWVRTYVSVAQSRVDTAGITSGSSAVTDVSILSTDTGRAVSGTGVPAVAYVSSVVANTSFVLSSSPITSTPVNATATNASASLTIKSVFPCNINNYANGEATTTGAGGANLTSPGSGAVSGGSTAAYYGPALILARSTVRKPIVAICSDSIFDGYSDDFHSSYFGPIQRACMQLGFPMVKLSRGGETAASFAAPLSRRFRAMALAGCTHAVVSYGTNDGLLSGANATSVLTRLTTIGNYLISLGIKPYVATVPPRTTSTNLFATVAQQTVGSSLVVPLATVNQAIRAGLTPYLGFIDMEGSVSSAQDSGFWAQAPVARQVADGATTSGSNIITSATAAFTTADIGYQLYVAGALTAGSVITGVTNATTVTTTANASATVTGAVLAVGANFATTDGVHPADSIMRGSITTKAVALMSTWSV